LGSVVAAWTEWMGLALRNKKSEDQVVKSVSSIYTTIRSD